LKAKVKASLISNFVECKKCRFRLPIRAFRLQSGIGKSTLLKRKENQTQLKAPVNFRLV